LPVHVDLNDLVHAGVLGLFDAATKFDPDKHAARRSPDNSLDLRSYTSPWSDRGYAASVTLSVPLIELW
jgi:hypothetical protein